MESHDPLDATERYREVGEGEAISAPQSPYGRDQQQSGNLVDSALTASNHSNGGSPSEEDCVLLKAVVYQAFAARELLMRGSVQLQEAAMRGKLLQQF
jgi:hypothetical protein